VTSATPVLTKGITGATFLASDGQSTCAVVCGGRVKCWGQYDTAAGIPGPLGSGSSEHQSLVPVFVKGLASVKRSQ